MSTPNQVAQCANPGDGKHPAGACPFKNKEIAIVPVRYALDEVFVSPQRQPHPLPGKGFKGALTLKSRAYTLRQLRDGWLYVYDETAKVLDEYEIKGAQFISASKGSKGHLLYLAPHTLMLIYSPERWTTRIKDEMTKNASLRGSWMRKVTPLSFATTLKAAHCGVTDLLAQVADLGMPNRDFSLSCTPLSQPEEEGKQGAIKLLRHKAAGTPEAYKAGMPDPKSAMMVALDDPLADLADLSMEVNNLLAKREALLGENDAIRKTNSHKLMMAEVTRNLARVRLDEKELPASVRGNVAKTQAFEEALDDYLGDRYLADAESMSAEPGMVTFNSPMAQQADAKLQRLRDQYGFNPSSKQVNQWKERAAFQDEVDWHGLNGFIKQYQVPLNELELALGRAHEDLRNGVTRLKADPLPFGLDNRTTRGQAYLLTLIAEAAQATTLSCTSQDHKKALEKLLDEKRRDNLLALAPYGFDAALHKGLSEQTVDNTWLSTSSGDMTALFGRTADLETLLGEERLKQKPWFQTVEAVIDAVKGAGQSLAKGAHAQIMAAILPHAWKNSLAGNLRLVLLESLLGDKPLQVDSGFKMRWGGFQSKMQPIVKQIAIISSPPPGHSTTVQAINGQLRALQQELDTLIAVEMPQLVRLKGELYQQQARQYIGDYLASVRTGVSKGVSAMNERVPNLGSFGGLVALLNLWNLSVVIAGTAQNAQSIGRERANMQLGSAFAWTGNAIAALYQGAAWEKLKPLTTGGGKRALTAISIKAAIKEGEHAVWVKAFSLRMLAFAGLGAVAAGLEAWDASLASKDPLISEMERTLLASKEYVLWGQTGIFGIQVLLTLVSRGVGGFSIGTVFAPWMVIGLFVLGIAYLVLTVLLNIFKRSDLEKWLLQSTWGKQPANWSAEDELARFELLVNKPGASLTVVRSPAQGWMDSGRPQWQLQLSLPAHLRGQTIGLKVIGQPIARAGQMVPVRSKEDLVRYQAAMQPKTLETQRGRWDEMVYTLPLGIDTNTAIKLELGYMGGMIQREFIFKGSSSSGGPVTLHSSSGDLGTMPALVVGKQGNK